jgi:hypothetical protein
MDNKAVLVVDGEIVKEGIKLLVEEFGRLHNLQLVSGLKDLLDCDLEASEFLRAVNSLNDCGFLSSHIHSYWKINKKYMGNPVSRARLDRVIVLKRRFKEIKAQIEVNIKAFEEGKTK